MENDAITAEEEPSFELTPEQATSFDSSVNAEKPSLFNRRRVLIAIAVSFAVVVGGGLLFNVSKSGKKTTQGEAELTATNTPADLLRSLRDRAANQRDAPSDEASLQMDEIALTVEPALPPVSFNRSPEVEMVRNYPPPAGAASAPPGTADQFPDMAPVYRSSLVPPVEGNLFAGSRQPPQPAAAGNPADEYFRTALAAQNAALASRSALPSYPTYGSQPSDYAAQNDQTNKQEFFDSSDNGGSVMNGRFLGDNAVWIGTIIPGILETAINTDLPGNVMARVTRNIYDSQTGRKLLIPQGTILIAKYNSSVSYAQHRVQIVWDTLIRPDGFQLDLEGMNSVDTTGMSGQAAVYHENWFEYLKAAGIVTMFSLANARMTETAAKYASDVSASAVAGSSADLVNQLGGNMVARAMNIQPTLTVDNGTLINVMLNKTLYLPSVDSLPVTRKYTLE